MFSQCWSRSTSRSASVWPVRPSTLRKVGVEPVCGRLRLIDDDGGECPDGDDQRRRATEVHDRDREAAPDPEPPELDRTDRLHERVEQQRERASRPGRGRRRERRVPRPPTPGSAGAEARPAASSAGSGSSAPRRGPSRRSYCAGRTASSGRRRTDGALARDPDDWWSQESLVRLKGRPSLATVTRMQPATAYRRPQRRAVARRSARPAPGDPPPRRPRRPRHPRRRRVPPGRAPYRRRERRPPAQPGCCRRRRPTALVIAVRRRAPDLDYR